MTKKLLSAIAAAALLSAAPAAAEDANLNGFQAKKRNTGIYVCFSRNLENVALIPELAFVESAIVIYDSNDKEVVKANTDYKEQTTGNYWTSKLPQNINLKAGCYTFHFMIKTTPPSTSVQWSCATAVSARGLTNSGDRVFTTLTGAIGAGALSHIVMLPGEPTDTPVGKNTCPSGRT